MPNEFVIKNGFISKGNSIVEGGITATTISASTYSNLPSPSITVGTSQLTSGTNGRVLFQSGTTLQQDGNFTFDSTLKRLTLKAVGSTVTDIPFIVRNSADTTDNFIVNGLGEGYFKSQQAQPYGLTIENTQTSSSSENTLGARVTFVSAGTNVGDRAYIHYHNSNGGGSSAGTFIFSSPRGFRMDSPGTYLSDNYRFTTTSAGNHLAFTALSAGNILRLNVAAGGSTSSEIQIANALSNYSYWRAPNSDVNHAMSWGRTSTEFMRLNQSGWLGIGTGASIGARLDVRAQGALSTDIAFRVRNSADTVDLFSVRGNGEMYIPQAPSNNQNVIYFAGTTDSIIRYSPTGIGSVAFGQGASITNATYYNTVIGSASQTGASAGLAIAIGFSSVVNSSGGIAIGDRARTSGADTIIIGNTGGNTTYSGARSIYLGKKGNNGNNFSSDDVFMTHFNSDLSSTLIRANGSLGLLGQQAYILTNGTGIYGTDTFMGNGGNTLVVRNHTSVPSTNLTDAFQQYSADITAGNAAPHFRTENGSIVKLYQETTGVTTSTLISNAGTTITDTDTFDGYTLQQIVKALRNLGVLQ